MNIISWFSDPANWTGSGGIPAQVGYHLLYSAIALLAAVLTPPDLISQVLLMAPLMLLYAASIAAAYAARYRMNRLERDAE